RIEHPSDNRILEININRLFKVWGKQDREQIRAMAAADDDEFVIEKIIEHYHYNPEKSDSTVMFKVVWEGYDSVDATWEPLDNLKGTEALDIYKEGGSELEELIDLEEEKKRKREKKKK
ncbi:hypothetical protein ADUPG1_003426, partial [Aduncisulcus paluster]